MKSRFFLVTLLCLAACSDNRTTITLHNTSSLTLRDKAVSIARENINSSAHLSDHPLITTTAGDTLAAQTDDVDGDGSWDELFFVVDLKPGERLPLHLHWLPTPLTVAPRTSIRFGKRDGEDGQVVARTSDTLDVSGIPGRLGYQPYQTDGPSWENDKVGFRHYFDGRNSKDLFGKTTTGMTPEDVGINAAGAVEDNYHVMAPWGRDVLPTATSGGLGGINLLIGDTLSRIGNLVGDTSLNVEKSVFRIQREGPVRSTLNITHYGWKPFDRRYDVSETIRIWPGMYAYQNTIDVSGLTGDETLLVGLVNSQTDEQLNELIRGDFVILYTHDKQTYDKTWWLGLGLILPRDVYVGSGSAPESGSFSQSYVGKMRIAEDKPVTYYAVGCWELSDPGFAKKEYFEQYLTDLADQLAATVEVAVSH